MTKNTFLTALSKGLSGLPEKELCEYISYYSEMIDDKIEDGIPEKKAVAEIGTPEENITKIIDETSFTKLVKNKLKPKRKLSTLVILLIVIGSPVWASLLIAVFAVIFSVFVSLVAALISLYAANLALAVSSLFSIILTVFYAARGNIAAAMLLFGAALILAGVSVFAFYGLKALTVKSFKGFKNLAINLKKKIMKKEEAK